MSVFYLILLVVLGLVAIAAIIGAIKGVEDRRGVLKRSWAGAVIIAVVYLLIVAAFSVSIVGTNKQEVRTEYGKPTGTVVGNGWNWVSPISTGTSFSSAKQWVRFVGNGDGGEDGSDEPKIPVRLAAGSTADVEGSVTYRQPADQVTALFMEFKTEERIRQLLILSNVQQALNEVFGKYDPLSTVTTDANMLATMSRDTEKALISRLGGKVTDITVNLTMVDLDQNTEDRLREIQAAIAKTRVAEQDKATADQIAQANRIIAESLKQDPAAAFVICVQTMAKALVDIKPTTIELNAICASSATVLR